MDLDYFVYLLVDGILGVVTFGMWWAYISDKMLKK